MGSDHYRTDHATNSGLNRDGYKREVTLACTFIIDRMQNMKPRSRRDPCANLMSVLSSWLAVRRVHARRTGVEMATANEAQYLIRVLLREYPEEHGTDSLRSKCKEPMRRHLIIRLLQTPSATRVGNRLVAVRDANVPVRSNDR